MLVFSIADGEVLDSAITDADGAFELDVVPAWNEDGDDFLALAAARLNEDGSIAYAIMDPSLPFGEQDIERRLEAGMANARVWSWTWTSSDIAAEEGVYLPLEAGSGAAFAFVYLSAIYDFSERFFGHRPGTSLALWLGFGTTWSCGACFINYPLVTNDLQLANQIFIPADGDEGYWSGAVLAHELGHWVMATYGVSPNEGGEHIFGIPSHPGLAWSEGFATWFSSVARDQSFYYDKQDGLFLWVDLEERAYSGGAPWYRPRADLGLEQMIDENEVARMLLGLTDDASFPSMFAALSSRRMTVSPFLRGYLRRTWDGLDQQGFPLPAWSTDQSSPRSVRSRSATCSRTLSRMTRSKDPSS
jgi:hypothetical protein